MGVKDAALKQQQQEAGREREKEREKERDREREGVGGIPNFLCSIKKFMTVWQKLPKK